MQVIVNYLDTGGIYGIKRYAIELVAALAAEGVDVHPRAVTKREISLGKVRIGGNITKRMHNVWPIWRRGLVHAADHRSNPILTPAKVVTVHDIIPVVHPEWGTPRVDLETTEKGAIRALRTAHVVTDTEFVRQQLIRIYDGDPDRITTVPLGIREDVFHPEPLPDDLIPLQDDRLTVVVFMDLDRRKRVDLVLEAALRLPFVQVIHAGRLPPTPSDPSVAEAAWRADRTLQAEGRLSRLDRIDDATLRRLFSSADVMVHPSLAEGFGFPPLEAMRCGARVLASDIPPHRETMGGAARYFEPTVDSLVEALTAIWAGKVRDEQFPDRDARIAQAARYTWVGTAKRMIDVYESIA